MHFEADWVYKSWAGKFLEDWADMAMASKLKMMKKVAKMLRSYKELILNWFSVPGGLSSRPVEGLNNKQNSLSKRRTALKHWTVCKERSIISLVSLKSLHPPTDFAEEPKFVHKT